MRDAHSPFIVTRAQVPEACVHRLSLYLREVARLEREGARFISSGDLARALQLTDAQVRRDFSYFGQFGVSGRGYEVRRLGEILGTILGLRGKVWRVALAGVGNLGSALLAYRGFRERGFLMRVAFDKDPRKVGATAGGVPVAAPERMAELVRRYRVKVGIIAVPVEEAQTVCDRLVAGGVKAVLNFAPVRLRVPATVRLRNVDLALELGHLAFYLNAPAARLRARTAPPLRGVLRPTAHPTVAGNGDAS